MRKIITLTIGILIVLIATINIINTIKVLKDSSRGSISMTVLMLAIPLSLFALIYFIHRWLYIRGYSKEKVNIKTSLISYFSYPTNSWIINTNLFKKLKNKILREILNLLADVIINFIIYILMISLLISLLYLIKIIIY